VEVIDLAHVAEDNILTTNDARWQQVLISWIDHVSHKTLSTTIKQAI
jgi:hypothetical protein